MILQFPQWLHEMTKCWNQEGNYGGGGIFVGVAPFAMITTNLGGSAVLHHHYDLDLFMITEGKGMETEHTTTQDTLYAL